MIQQLLDRAKELCAGAESVKRKGANAPDGSTSGSSPLSQPEAMLRLKQADWLEACRVADASRELVPLLLKIVEVQREALEFVRSRKFLCDIRCDCCDEGNTSAPCTCMDYDIIEEFDKCDKRAEEAISSCDEIAGKWGKK